MTPLLEPVSWAVTIALVLIGLAYVLAVIRLILGPTLPDRVVALDLIASLTLGFSAVHALRTGEWVLLNVSVVIALVCFLATIAFAQYLERKTHKQSEEFD